MANKTSINTAYSHMFFMLLAISFACMRQQWSILILICPSFLLHSIITFFAITKKIDVKSLSINLFIPSFYLLFSTVTAYKIHPYIFWLFMLIAPFLMISDFNNFSKLYKKWPTLKEIMDQITPNSMEDIYRIKFFNSQSCRPFEIIYKDSDIKIQLENTQEYYMNVHDKWLSESSVALLLKDINKKSIFSLEKEDLELIEMLEI